MKRNWTIIIAIVGLIIAYETLILGPYQKKYVQPQAESSATSTSTGQTGTSAGTPMPANPEAPLSDRIKVTEQQKKKSERRDVNDSRYYSIYSDGGIGNVLFNRYFQRGKDKQLSVELIENGFHWRSTDVRVDGCLKSLTKSGDLLFSGKGDGISCKVQYSPNKLIVNTAITIESATAVSGDLFFETDDPIGEGPAFDHRNLALKKKDEKASKIRDKKLTDSAERASGPYDWVSWGDKYFAAVLLPTGRFNPDVFYSAGFGQNSVHWGLAYPLKWDANEKQITYNFGIYFALKDLKELRSVRPDLDQSIDFGFFGAIAKFMLWSLEALYSIFHNYGVAIIILSLIIRLLLWPVNKKMFESGQKMKDIQPEMEKIKKKYEGKTDQLLMMNQEIRVLYKNSGVNPLGSCLPVFLQIPIFFGLNSALSNSVDLYQAPFFGWIHDLSYKDPLYILPVVWTISLMISVELTPQPAAQPGMPNMKWVSRIMFVVFGFISKDFPSGLNLYFLVSNVAGMGQQGLFRKKATVGKSNILIGKEK